MADQQAAVVQDANQWWGVEGTAQKMTEIRMMRGDQPAHPRELVRQCFNALHQWEGVALIGYIDEGNS
jgi:hypothetical protein